MTLEINKKILEEAARKLEGINELSIVNMRLESMLDYKRNEYMEAVFPRYKDMSSEQISEALNELFDAADSVCIMNNQPVPVEFALLSSTEERFIFQLEAKEKGFKNWQILAMRQAIGIDSLIGLLD